MPLALPKVRRSGEHSKAAKTMEECNDWRESAARRTSHLMLKPGRAARHGAPFCLAMLLCAAQLTGTSSFGASPEALPARLKPRTLDAFERYVRLTEARNTEELSQGEIFLRPDALPQEERAAAYAALRKGEVRIERLKTHDAGNAIECPSGLIHHWLVSIYIPGATLEETLRGLEDYDHHTQHYAPDARRSKILSHEGEEFHVFLQFRRKKVITVVLNTEHDVRYSRLDPVHAASRSTATRVAEVENAGKSNEREKTPGDDGGYLWRMETLWGFAERHRGPHCECETLSPPPHIPRGFGWLAGPFCHKHPPPTPNVTPTGPP